MLSQGSFLLRLNPPCAPATYTTPSYVTNLLVQTRHACFHYIPAVIVLEIASQRLTTTHQASVCQAPPVSFLQTRGQPTIQQAAVHRMLLPDRRAREYNAHLPTTPRGRAPYLWCVTTQRGHLHPQQD